MKVIFLDIDGVVNTPLPYKGKIRYFHERDGRVNNKQAIQLLNQLCKETGARIVVSSTWRYDGFERIQEILVNSGLKADIIGITPILKDGVNNIRGDEIQAWIDKQEIKPEKYIILDDDEDLYEDQIEHHFVKCEGLIGFTIKQYVEAKDLLSDD